MPINPRKARKINRHANKKSKNRNKKIKTKIRQSIKIKLKPKAKNISKAMKVKQKQIKIAKKSKTEIDDVEAQYRKEILAKYLINPDIRKRLVNVAGENTIPVLKLFKNGSTDEEFASKISAKVADIRATLNKLHGIGLISYKRVRDSESGWYKYTWIMNIEKLKEWASQEEGVMQEGDYYSCGKCYSGRYSFEDAMDISFRCPQCGSSLDTYHEQS